jgi:hypothetical protein
MAKSDIAPIFLSHQEHIDLILRDQRRERLEAEIRKHRALLWPLPRAERIARLTDIRLDLEYEDTLELVSAAMQERRHINRVVRASWAAALAVNFGFIALAGYLVFQMLRPLQ